MGALARGHSLGNAAPWPGERRAGAALGSPNVLSLQCQGHGHLGFLGTGTGELVLMPPQRLDRGTCDPSKPGGTFLAARGPRGRAAPNSSGYKEHKETRKEPFTW